MKLPILTLVAALWLAQGCATRSVVVIDTAKDVVRLDEPVTASVSTYDHGVWKSAGKAKLPAGWYAGPGRK